MLFLREMGIGRNRILPEQCDPPAGPGKGAGGYRRGLPGRERVHRAAPAPGGSVFRAVGQAEEPGEKPPAVSGAAPAGAVPCGASELVPGAGAGLCGDGPAGGRAGADRPQP